MIQIGIKEILYRDGGHDTRLCNLGSKNNQSQPAHIELPKQNIYMFILLHTLGLFTKTSW